MEDGIISSNKLIAEFEQRKFYGTHTIDKYGGDTGNAYPEMHYHISWDWLMPVVEKICKSNPKEGKEWYWYEISYCHCKISIHGSLGEADGFKHNSDTTIKATWLAVIEFIKWHNQQNTINEKNR